MISSAKVLVQFHREIKQFKQDLPTEYEKGILYGLRVGVRIIEDEQARVKCAQESPFIWKADVMRRMIRQAIAYFNRADRAKGIRLLESVLQQGSPSSAKEKD